VAEELLRRLPPHSRQLRRRRRAVAGCALASGTLHSKEARASSAAPARRRTPASA
jgi:hypothetical protein